MTANQCMLPFRLDEEDFLELRLNTGMRKKADSRDFQLKMVAGVRRECIAEFADLQKSTHK